MRLTIRLHRDAVPVTQRVDTPEGAVSAGEEPGPHTDILYDMDLRDDVRLDYVEVLVDGHTLVESWFRNMAGWLPAPSQDPATEGGYLSYEVHGYGDTTTDG